MSGQAQTAEEALFIQRLKARDEAALEALIAQYGAKVFGLALRITADRQDAEEVLQDVFWRVLQNIDSFRGESKLSSWIYRITTNTALMKVRERPKNQHIPLEEQLGPAMTEDGMIAEPVVDWTQLPTAELERRELAQRLEEAIDQMPSDYRTVFVLRDMEGLSTEEACEVLGLSVAALKSRLHRARLFLRKQLADYVTARYPAIMPPAQRSRDAQMS